MTPVTVLMPVYNGESYLERAIQSILIQTFENFKFLIVDDGSTDSSLDIINHYKGKDSRISVVVNAQNLGLIETLNNGLDAIDTKYVARMDSDDYAMPSRLEKQVNLMEANPSIGACGTWITVNNVAEGSKHIQRYPTQHAEIKIHMLSYCAVAHPTIMLRKSFFDKYSLRYDPEFIHTEDYELWTRAIEKFQFANIAEPLLDYSIHMENVSSKNETTQLSISSKIRSKQISKLVIPKPNDELIVKHLFTDGLRDISSQKHFIEAQDLLERLVIANKNRKLYDEVLFDHYLFKTWYHLCKKCRIPEISPTQEFIYAKISRQHGYFRFIFLSSKLLFKELRRALFSKRKAA